MKNIARVLLTLVIVAAGCVGGYELWDYYLFSPCFVFLRSEGSDPSLRLHS